MASHRVRDPELQRIVERVCIELDFPMALLSQTRRRAGLCGACVGWPRSGSDGRALELAASSCCEPVVATGRPLEVANALGDPQLPQDLVRAYGIRSYVGLPLTMCGRVLGGLCAIDTRPRHVTPHEHQRLGQLAVRAAARLAEIAPDGLRAEHLITHAVHPAFLEIRNLLNVLLGDISLLGLALGDVRTVLDLVRNADALLSAGAREQAFDVLRDALLTNQDLRVTHARLETTGARLTRYLLALEASLTAGEDAVELRGAIELAGELARHVTGVVGGVRWQLDQVGPTVTGPKVAAVAGIAAALRLIAEGLGAGAAHGIDGRLSCARSWATITLSAPEGSADIYRTAGAALHAYARSDIGLAVATSNAHVALTWRRHLGRAS